MTGQPDPLDALRRALPLVELSAEARIAAEGIIGYLGAILADGRCRYEPDAHVIARQLDDVVAHLTEPGGIRGNACDMRPQKPITPELLTLVSILERGQFPDGVLALRVKELLPYIDRAVRAYPSPRGSVLRSARDSFG